jgi:hypothetical protein
MPEKYGAHETATLFVLLSENRAIPNPELRNEYGIELKPAPRTKLNKAGLLETTKEGRRLVHQITPAGIDWCETELVAGVALPTRPGPLVRTAFEILRLLVVDLRRRGIRLVDVFRPDGAETTAKTVDEEPVSLESLIRRAYGELSVKPQDWVRLAKLRPRLDGAEKDEVDHALLTMVRTGLVHLAPDSNRKVLTDADHAAAIRIGSENKHLIAIEES